MADQSVLITSGQVIDATGAPPHSASVLLKGNRIAEVGDIPSDRAIREGAQVLDASGCWILPGMIDAHCHMTYGDARSEEEIDLYTSHESRTLRAAWNAARVLGAGVTSISQPGGSYYIGVGLREAINTGYVVGPRMAAAGRYITTSNGLTDWYPDSVGVPEGSIGILANTIDEMTSEIRHQIKNGVDFIKIADSPMGNFQAFTNDELKRCADLTHQLGKRITIHARGSSEVSAAIDAGFDWIMHGNTMTDDVIAKLADSKIPLVPTLTLLENATQHGGEIGVPSSLRDAWSNMLENTGETLHRAHDAGVVFVTGTDSGFSLTPYGEWHALELELLVTYAGLSAMEAIQAATRNAAVTVTAERDLGLLVPGMLADLIVVDCDPLKNIAALQDQTHITHIIKDGVAVDRQIMQMRRPWPHERGLTYSTTDLTWAGVHERTAANDDYPEAPSDDDAESTLELVRRGERAARAGN